MLKSFITVVFVLCVVGGIFVYYERDWIVSTLLENLGFPSNNGTSSPTLTKTDNPEPSANLTATPAPTQGPANPLWPKAGQSYSNSLHVKLVPAGTDGVLFSIYDVRLKDFQLFARETNLAISSEHMYGYEVKTKPDGSPCSDYYADPGINWQSPGFFQQDNEPVVGVSWLEMQSFCQWLTNKERTAGLIGPNQLYRLPKRAEWAQAAGSGTYPWGNSWPPSRDDGNFLDEAWNAAHGDNWNNILPENDGFVYTSPVGSFSPNSYGLYDMAGNVSQECDDLDPHNPAHHLWLGSNWSNDLQEGLRTDYQGQSCGPTYRYNFLGFRVVLVTGQ